MRTAVGVLFTTVVMIVAVWILVFGSSSAVIARRRGSSPASAFRWGSLAGPIAWAWIFWTTREKTVTKRWRWVRRARPEAQQDGHVTVQEPLEATDFPV